MDIGNRFIVLMYAHSQDIGHFHAVVAAIEGSVAAPAQHSSARNALRVLVIAARTLRLSLRKVCFPIAFFSVASARSTLLSLTFVLFPSSFETKNSHPCVLLIKAILLILCISIAKFAVIVGVILLARPSKEVSCQHPRRPMVFWCWRRLRTLALTALPNCKFSIGSFVRHRESTIS